MAQTIIGTVISDKMQNTVTVKTTSKSRHPLYKKLVTISKKFKAHNTIGAKITDQVKIVETKPFSKTVHFKVLEIINKEK